MKVAILLVTLALIVAVASALRAKPQPFFLSETEAECLNTCPKGKMCAMYCLPSQRFDQLSDAAFFYDTKLYSKLQKLRQIVRGDKTLSELRPYPGMPSPYINRPMPPVSRDLLFSDSELKINKCEVCQYAVKAIKTYGPKILNEQNKEKVCAPFDKFSTLCKSLITKLVDFVHDKADPYKTCAFYKMCPKTN